jgi:P pilus assembly chaperone PapD
VLCAASVASTEPALAAASVGIVPTRLAIAHSGNSTDLTIENEGRETVSYSVSAYRWHQAPDGRVLLAPTDDLIVYPQRLTLGALETRPIRIGFVGPLQAVEQDFRIVVTEVASSSDALAGGAGLTVRTRVSVPLFIAPTARTSGVDVRAASLTPSAATFSLFSTGSAYAFATSVRLRAEDAAGALVFDTSLNGWYLLSGQPRVYSVTLAPALCARIRRLTVDAAFEAGPPLHAVLEPSHAC